MSAEQEIPETKKEPLDVWGFVLAAKASVKRELMRAKFNPDNRPGHIGAKAVLDLLSLNGLNVVKMYDSVGQTPRHIKYKAPPMGDVCTVRVKCSVHGNDMAKIDEFEFEFSWIQDPREKFMTPVDRITYVENKIYAESMLVGAEKVAEQVQQHGSARWPSIQQLGVMEWHELPKNSRPVE